MKKVLVQLVQWILKNKKKLIYGALALFIGNVCFFGLGGIGVENEVFAADAQTQNASIQTKITEMWGVMKVFQKIIYMLIYPFLILAGKLVDNSLIYGENFGFDAVLRNLWIMVRNIANFALGFIFIFYIFKYLITHDEKHGPKWLIIRSLIAGVGIQASWFILAALIDISTIVIYGVGGLPISVLGGESGGKEQLKENPYVLNTVISIDADDLDSSDVYLSNPSKTDFISSCVTFNYSYTGENGVKIEKILIIGPEMTYYQSGTSECYPTQLGRCHIGDQVYRLGVNLESAQEHYPSCTERRNYQNHYKESLEETKKNYASTGKDIIESKINAGEILHIGISTGSKDNPFGLDTGNAIIGLEWSSLRLEDILDDSYVGVFGSLYGSLLNAGADLKISNNDSVYAQLLNVALSLGHMIAINIPLIVMLAVFMIRICVLWLAIALSPIIVLFKVFDFESSIDKLNINFLKYLKVSNLIGIIFSPAIICFAISMSTVLVRIIVLENWDTIDTVKTPILGGLISLDLAGAGIKIGKLVISALGIAVTRFLMWAAVKFSAIGESNIIKGLEKLANTTLGSMPVIPVPGKDGKTEFMGVGTVFGRDGNGGIISQYADKLKSQYDKESLDSLDQLFDGQAGEKASQARSERYWEQLKSFGEKSSLGENRMGTGFTIGNGKDTIRFSDLEQNQQEDIITKINELEESVRKKFGTSSKSIRIGDKIYEFIEQEGEVDGSNNPVIGEDGKQKMKKIYQYKLKK